MGKLITMLYFQIGVNVIGLPELIKHDISKAFTSKSKFSKLDNGNYFKT
jgi:hypothetical protein